MGSDLFHLALDTGEREGDTGRPEAEDDEKKVAANNNITNIYFCQDNLLPSFLA